MGTEEFWIPAVLAAVSAGGEAANQHAAQNRQNDATIQGLADQQKYQQEAGSRTNQFIKQVAGNSPDKTAATTTGEYVNQLRRNAAGSTARQPATSALAPVAGASKAYAADAANSQQDVSNYGADLAKTMGAIDAPVRQRQNEELGMQTLGTGLNDLNARSYGSSFVDQLRSQLAGQTNPWVGLASSLVGGAANAYSMNHAPKVPNPATGKTLSSTMGTGYFGQDGSTSAFN